MWYFLIFYQLCLKTRKIKIGEKMSEPRKKTILCISSYYKGLEFLREAHRQGWHVVFITSRSLEHESWPRGSIDELYFMPDNNKEWVLSDLIKAVSYLARNTVIDKIAALDDFDVEKAAALREHLRVPGMGETTMRYFRDKFSMRMKAREEGVLVPDFIHILNYDEINKFMDSVQPPFIMKPRMQAGAIGMKKIDTKGQAWEVINQMGDDQSNYLMEKFIPGDIFHVDTIIQDGEIKFAICSIYGLPPFEVAHHGRVFTTRTVLRGSDDENALLDINARVLKSLGMRTGVNHTEFIKGKDGSFYFLETSARVGGANIVELVEAASGINLWAEWAKLETLEPGKKYKLPKLKKNYAALLNSLAKQQFPDMNAYNDPEVYWRLNKEYHAGLVISSPKYERTTKLLDEYVSRFYSDFFHFIPMTDKSSN
jgi:biotin carboxylase